MKYDVAIIGGGPAGMMAAGRAAQCGARVVLIEGNDALGKKLLITGKGRCNLTHAEPDMKKFIEPFGKNGRFLFSALNKFGVEDAISFFEERGVKTKVERGDRVFPESDNALDIKRVLRGYLEENKATVLKNSLAEYFVKEENVIDYIYLTDGRKILADKFIIATGGLSYPATGSKGDGMKWAKKLGHTVIPPQPSLSPVLTKEKWVKDLQGLSLKNVSISIYQKNKKQDERFGEALFTHEGMSGPIILDMSKKISKLLQENSPIEISIDFKPALSFVVLDNRIQRDFKENINRMFKNSLDALLPKKLIPVIIKLSEIDPDKPVNEVTKEERNKLLHLLKELKLTIRNISGFGKAIITSGGVSLKEVEPKTMQSKIVNNLYFAGEILDIDGPTGGYNLQVAWSTGYVAGESVVSANTS